MSVRRPGGPADQRLLQRDDPLHRRPGPAPTASPTEQALVARVAPTGYTVFLDPDFLGECRVMRAVAERTAVPMPSVLGIEEDTDPPRGPVHGHAPGRRDGPHGRPTVRRRGMAGRGDPRPAGAGLVERHRGDGRRPHHRLAGARPRLPGRPAPRPPGDRPAAGLLPGLPRLGPRRAPGAGGGGRLRLAGGQPAGRGGPAVAAVGGQPAGQPDLRRLRVRGRPRLGDDLPGPARDGPGLVALLRPAVHRGHRPAPPAGLPAAGRRPSTATPSCSDARSGTWPTTRSSPAFASR